MLFSAEESVKILEIGVVELLRPAGWVMGDAVIVDGESLSCAHVSAVSRYGVGVDVAARARERARTAWRTAHEVAAARPVYGRTTGVGSNRAVGVAGGAGGPASEHGLRLLRSHAGDAGPRIATDRARALLVVRLNQLAAGGSGVEPTVLDVLAAALNRGLAPPVRSIGAVGTGDLTALASTALCVIGERPWLGGTLDPHPLEAADALAFVSSNAATIGEAALACTDITELLEASLVVGCLSFLAVDGSTEPYAPAVHEARPHHGQRQVATRIRELLAAEPPRPARLQDPYGYRAFPQVHGPAVEACERLDETLAIDMNSASENPLVDIAGHDVTHNGNFHTAPLALALDAARAALFQTAALSTARLGTLVEPAFTGLRPYLATGQTGSSGVMILEYVAHAALAEIRRHAAPASVATAVLARGVEEHASFATQAARSAAEAIDGYRAVLACELVAASRALRLRGTRPRGGVLRRAQDAAVAALDPRTDDRPLDADIAAAQQLLPELARLSLGGERAGGGPFVQGG